MLPRTFTLGAVTVRISKRDSTASNQQPALDLINSSLVDYLTKLPHNELHRRLDAVTVDSIKNEAGYKQAARILHDNGCVVVRNFLPSEIRHELANVSNFLMPTLTTATRTGRNFEDHRISVQVRGGKLTTYKALASYPKAVACIRQGADQGMVDVFKIDRLIDDRESIRAPFETPWLKKLVTEYSPGRIPSAQNLNLYWNRSVTKTRGFHIDCVEPSLKGLVYLTDTNTFDAGPYCYCVRSPRDKFLRVANHLLSEACQNPTDAPLVDLRHIVPILADAGTLVLSDQSGIHRGIPQSPGMERQVLVMRYA